MGKTRHIQARMSQRGIKQNMVDLTLQYGVPQKDKTFLNRNGLSALLNELRALEKTVIGMIKKGGVVVVGCDGTLITTYNLNSYKNMRC